LNETLFVSFRIEGNLCGFQKHFKLLCSYSDLESLLLERTAALEKLSQKLLRLQEEERRKIARDLHDTTGQTLAALKMSAWSLKEKCQESPPSMTALVSEVLILADKAIGEIRTMSYLLHPPLLDEVGFACAANWYIEGFAKRSGINIKAEIAKPRTRLPHDIEITLFRVLQESLTNVHRHSGASNAQICFQEKDDAVTLEIRDFGKGITEDRLRVLNEAGAEIGVGLAGMRERLVELDGKLEMESDGSGTRLRATVPLLPVSPCEGLGNVGPSAQA
jgi:signal transduction histidine kinase